MELKKKKINYARFVQGFFHMYLQIILKLKDLIKIQNIFLSDSEYSIKWQEMFPEFSKKIIRINFSIDTKIQN